MRPFFRADQVGSMLRPQRLKEAREKAGFAMAAADFAKQVDGEGRIVKEASAKPRDLVHLEDQCIKELVKFEEDLGLATVTDGELRRGSWLLDVTLRIDGLALMPGNTERALQWKNNGGRGGASYMVHAVGKLGRKPGGLVQQEYAYTAGLTDRTVKVTMPSPTLLYLQGGREAVSSEVYPDIEEYFEDLTGLYRDEIQDLHAAGCRYVQIDHTDAARLCDPKLREGMVAKGRDPESEISLQAKIVSMCTRGRPDDMTVSMHICRGNSNGGWFAEGGYDPVAEKLFSEFDVDTFFLEYDSERAGDFTPLRYVPPGKRVALGLVTTKTPENDDKDTLKRRIEEAAKYVPIENLALSPQCGFASGARGNPISFDDERRKLATIVEVAREVWGSV